MPMNRAILTATNPACTASRHLSERAWRVGCRCPEAIAGRNARVANARVRDAARRTAVRKNPPQPEVVDLDEADHVVIERVLAKKLRFTAVTHPADRVAIVDTIVRTAGVSMVSRTLNISGITAAKLIRVAEASRARVAA